MKKIGIGYVGCGGRGLGVLRGLLGMEDVEVRCICDRQPDRLEMGMEAVRAAYNHDIDGTLNHKELVARDDIDAVIIPSSWNDHLPVAIDAMNAGKYAAFEIGAVASVEQCWELVRTAERTGMHAMALENCCYGKNELTVLNMIKKGLFGELVHVQGGYQHDLRAMVVDRMEDGHERTYHNLHRCGELYPTHELGPIQTFLNINRGNRMLTLSAMSCKPRGLHKYAVDKYGADSEKGQLDFVNGDVTTTMIKCAHGETIVLTHDILTPRPYSRGGRVQGTKGLWMEDNASIYVDGRSPAHQWEKMEDYLEEYEHPLWKQFKKNMKGGHGGMDYLVMRGFLEAVRNKTAPPIDVYDSATMIVVSCLSEQSIAMGGAPVPIPDFTDGKWIKRGPAPKSIFSLTEVDDSLYNDDIEI